MEHVRLLDPWGMPISNLSPKIPVGNAAFIRSPLLRSRTKCASGYPKYHSYGEVSQIDAGCLEVAITLFDALGQKEGSKAACMEWMAQRIGKRTKFVRNTFTWVLKMGTRKREDNCAEKMVPPRLYPCMASGPGERVCFSTGHIPEGQGLLGSELCHHLHCASDSPVCHASGSNPPHRLPHPSTPRTRLVQGEVRNLLRQWDRSDGAGRRR